MLSAGEEASYTSHDGTRVSARLYLPSPATGRAGPYPVVLYVHGGPQSQERPDFTWFSMPLIQLFTLRGFAVFVPNVRGSTGYGLAYTKQVDRDWGGADRLDHIAGVETLRSDARLDVDRLGVMGRSYGGFMTLTLLGRHPEMWTAGVDMFGPYDLFTFIEALPETWKTYMHMAMGHPERDRELLVERSPKTHLDALAAPLLVIQGRNDPRVVVGESDMLVDDLRPKARTSSTSSSTTRATTWSSTTTRSPPTSASSSSSKSTSPAERHTVSRWRVTASIVRAGKRMRALRNSKSPSTVIPTTRNGSDSNHTSG